MTPTPPPAIDAHPHARIARRLWEAAATADTETLRELLAPEVVWLAGGHNPLSGEYYGPEGIIEYLSSVGEAIDDLTSRLDAVYVGEGGAVLAYHVSARAGEAELEMDFLLRLWIRDGRVVRARTHSADQRANDAFWTRALAASAADRS